MIAFAVRGIPAPQGSKRLLPLNARPGGRPIMVESSKRVPKWRRAIADAARAALDLLSADEQRLATGSVLVDLAFRLPRPRSHYGTGRNAALLKSSAPIRPTTKPDLDKLARACLDALTGVLWVDDSQVVMLLVSKDYAGDGTHPGVYVRVDVDHRPQRRDAAKED